MKSSSFAVENSLMSKTMQAAYLPGNSTVEMRTVEVPAPGYGEVLLRVEASTICGSDMRCIYHEHLGKGPEGYQGVIAGHEPSGQVVEAGPGCRRFKTGDRALVYHISGCGVCNDCRRGYMISCTSSQYRRAYGWQRDNLRLIGSSADVESLAASVPNSGGVVFVPAFVGLGAPHWDRSEEPRVGEDGR